MYRLAIFSIVLILSSNLVMAKDQKQIALTELEKQKVGLVIQKLQIEISSLNKNSNRKDITQCSVIIGSLLGFFSFIWSVHQGLQAVRSKTEEGRLNRVSALLEKLSSKEVDIRLGAVRGLSQYADFAIQELLSSSSTEESAIVKSNLEDTIALIGKKKRHEIIDSNSRTILKRIYAEGRLNGLGYDFNANENNLSFNRYIKKYFKDSYEHGMLVGKLQLEKNGGNQNVLNDHITQQKQILENENQLAHVTRAVISHWIKNDAIESLDVDSLDLTESNLYRAKLPRVKSKCFILSSSLMRHSEIKFASIENGIFDNSDMLDSNISNSKFNKTSFNCVNMRLAIGRSSHFIECNFQESVLSEGDFSYSSFKKSTCIKTKFRKTKLMSSNFSCATLNQSEFQSANMSNSKLTNEKFCGALMVNANMQAVQAESCMFNGADFGGALMKNTKMTKTKGLESAINIA